MAIEPSLQKILIIDDEEDIRDACKLALEKQGFCVITATDGKEGLRLFRQEAPAVVLVDLKMPGMSGLEVLEAIREANELVVAVVITGYGTVENAVEAMKKGVFEFISKPFTPDQLRMVVSGAVKKFKLLSENRAMMRERERLRKNLLSLVSHELRSPLAVVIQYLDVILAGIMGEVSPEVKGVIQRCKERLAEMLELVGKWITLATFDSQQLKESFLPVDLVGTVSEVMEGLEEEARARGISLDLSCQGSSLRVLGSKVAISEAIRNLISNAIKYNREEGKVFVRIYTQEDKAKIEVRDTGPGIPEEHLERIFDEFYRVDGRRNAPIKGSGLGLAIVKKLVETHDGKVEVSSFPGQGACFTVSLPLPA